MSINLRVVVISALLLLSFIFITSTAFAKHNSEIKPGWGFGDLNHLHVGPPGLSVNVNQSNNANLSNVISFSANTGGNTISGNTGGSSTLLSGAVSALIRIRNTLGQNVFNLSFGAN